MQQIAQYQEACITLAPDEAPDLYAIHERVMSLTNGNKGITCAPIGRDGEGRMAVLFRAMLGVSLPGGLPTERKSIEEAMTFTVNAGVRLVKQTRYGERMPIVDEAMEKWHRVLADGGFSTKNTQMVESAIAFYHRRLDQNTRLPFWAVSSDLTVMDAEKAAETMVRGVGRSRGLGFGMLMKAA